MLERGGREVGLQEWGAELLKQCEPVAAALDAAHGGSAYRDALASGGAALSNSDSVPSARVLGEMASRFDNSYVAFVLAHSVKHREALQRLPLSPETEANFARLAQVSLAEQKRIEAADTMPFEIFRQKYLSPERLGV